MAVPSDCPDPYQEALRLDFPRLPYSRGSNLDMMNIMARSPKTTNLSVREGPISILFEAAQGKSILAWIEKCSLTDPRNRPSRLPCCSARQTTFNLSVEFGEL